MVGSMTLAQANRILDHQIGGPNYSRPGTLYVGLVTAISADGSTFTEVAAAGAYARIATPNDATNWPAAALGRKTNANVITFATATASWGLVRGWILADAASGGNVLYWGRLTDPAATALPFVIDAGTEVLHTPGHALVNDDRVVVAGDLLPASLLTQDVYYARTVVAGTSLQVALTLGGAAINLAAGSGTISRDGSKQIDAGDTPSIAAGQIQIDQQ
jgi:hypothetical protein